MTHAFATAEQLATAPDLRDPWDESLREAHALGEVIVYRGKWPHVEIAVVPLDMSAEDRFADACRRAFEEDGE